MASQNQGKVEDRIASNVSEDNDRDENDTSHAYQSLKHSARVLAETKKQLQKNQAFVTAVLDNMTEGVVACDADGNLTLFNRSLAQLHGKEVASMPAEEWGQYYSLYQSDEVTPLKMEDIPLFRAHKGEVVRDFSQVIKTVEGEIRHVNVSAQPMLDKNGTRIGAVATMYDMTEFLNSQAKQKEAENNLIESEKRFRSAFDSAPHGMALVSLEGDWLLVNQSLCNVFGYSALELLDSNFQSMTFEDDLEEDMQFVSKLINNELDSYEMEKRFYHKNGEIIWVLLSVSIIRDEFDKPLYFVTQVQDLSDKKEMEIKKREQEKLQLEKEAAEAASLAKSSFLANMSHELRTPLNAIIGYSEMLAEEVDESEQSYSDLKKIQTAGKHLLGLINDVLDLSKIEAGKMDVSPEQCRVGELVDEVTSTIEPLVMKNGNVLKVDSDCNDVSMYSDIQKIKQILYNLFSNAAKFTHDGEIRLVATLDDKESSGRKIIFKVYDTGIGIEKEKISELFTEFTQASIETTRTYGGTGLGLTITKRFCELLGGQIEAYSEVGKGTEFIVSLPVTCPAESLAREPDYEKDTVENKPDSDLVVEDKKSDVTSYGNNLVLVIDDDVDAAELVCQHLSKLDYIVEVAADGIEGIKRAKDLMPCAIILDILMADMNGWSVLKSLKTDEQLKHIPVVMSSIIDEKQKGYKLGANDYLMKPVDRKELKQTLESLLASTAA